ncbi:hypothetical protein EC988_001154 [Linderina pennispora]|nr:hypothetical protein EC988_001154 [Linderina pennispora]
MKVLFKLGGALPITTEAVPFMTVLTAMAGFGVYTGVTRLKDKHYIRLAPQHCYKNPHEPVGKDAK